MRVRFGHQQSLFGLILARFLDYYSLFCGPKAISIVVEPQGALTCRSSTLAVLADSGHFRGLLLTVMVYRTDYNYLRSMIDDPSGAIPSRASTLAVLADSAPFHGLLLIVLGSRRISTIDAPRGAFTCRSPAILVLFDSGLFHGLLLTILGSQSYFHD